MTVKEQVLEVISRMPDDSTIDDIGCALYVIETVQKGLDELDRGDYLTHDPKPTSVGAKPRKPLEGV